jgi:hypothetical protein
VALHDVELTGEADVGEAVLHPVQVGAGDRADVGVDQGGDEALVLADRLGDLAGDGHEDAGGALVDDLAGAALVGVVADRPEEGDRDRLHPGGDERVGGRGDGGLVEGDDDVAVGVDPLGDAEGALDRHQRLGLAGFGEAQEVLGRLAGRPAEAAHRPHRVLEAARRDQPDRGAFALDHDVGGDGRAVRDQPVHLGVDLAAGEAELVARRLDRAEEPGFEAVGRRRERLAIGDATVLVDQHAVGEGAADIDTADHSGQSFLLS